VGGRGEEVGSSIDVGGVEAGAGIGVLSMGRLQANERKAIRARK
jgi:hypothetical protein